MHSHVIRLVGSLVWAGMGLGDEILWDRIQSIPSQVQYVCMQFRMCALKLVQHICVCMVFKSSYDSFIFSIHFLFLGVLYYNKLDICVILIDVLKSYPDVGSSRASFRRAASSRSIRSNRRRDSMFPGINGRFEIDVFILHPSIVYIHTYIQSFMQRCRG